jgi:hypothetical protein
MRSSAGRLQIHEYFGFGKTNSFDLGWRNQDNFASMLVAYLADQLSNRPVQVIDHKIAHAADHSIGPLDMGAQ